MVSSFKVHGGLNQKYLSDGDYRVIYRHILKEILIFLKLLLEHSCTHLVMSSIKFN